MNPTKPTAVLLWHVECKDFGHQGITYVLAGDAYGRLLGGTAHHELAEFNAWEDPVFDEVADLVHELLGRERGTSHCFHRILGYAVDPAPSGEFYDFTGRVWCPVCGSPNVNYGPDNPPKLDTIDMPQATHHFWQQLSAAEQRERIRLALLENGCRLDDHSHNQSVKSLISD